LKDWAILAAAAGFSVMINSTGLPDGSFLIFGGTNFLVFAFVFLSESHQCVSTW
jgi:hypothetical protein